MLDFAFPPLCAGCGSFCEEDSAICETCRTEIDWLSRPTYLFPAATGDEGKMRPRESLPVFAAGDYVDPLRQLIIQIKFRSVLRPVGFLAKRIADEFGDDLADFRPTHLLPVPLHPTREYSRGYNQAWLLANDLSAVLEVPVESDLLCRVRQRRPQARLSEARRAANIRGVFTVNESCEVDPNSARIILIDDQC